jgi:hypothetical protein
MNCLGSSSIYFSINHAPRGLFARNRERIGKGGSVGKKEEGQGVFGKTALLLPPLDSEQRGRRARHGRPAGAPAGDSNRGGGRGQGEKEEGGEGVLSPHSPWAIGHGGGGSAAGRGRRRR